MSKFKNLSDKKRKFIKFLILTGFAIFLLGVCYLIYYFIGNDVINLKDFKNLRFLMMIPSFGVISIWIKLCIKIFKNKNNKKSVRGVDITKIKEYGVARFMHNELENKNKSKEEVTLKEFHKHFGCDEPKCVQNNKKGKKKKISLEPAWVVCTQFRDKKTNALIAPPIEQDFLIYDEETENNRLDVDRFDEAQTKWLENIKDNFKNYNLINHTLNKLHLLVLGSTGSGKTQKLIFPGVIRNANLEDDKKPTMVITDPKGEIFQQTSGVMVKQGYDVKVLNFRDTTSTHSWNPLAITWKYREEAIFYKLRNTIIKTFSKISSVKEFINKETVKVAGNEVKIKCQFHDEISCVDCINEFEQKLYSKGYEEGENIKLYISEGRFHINEQDFNTKVDNKIKTLKSQSEKELLTLGSIIIQSSGNDPFWANAARGYFIGIAAIMLEIMDKNPGALPLEKFNIVNIVKMMDEQDPQKWVNKFKEIKALRGEQSFAYSQISNVVNASENTQKSITLTAKTETTLYSFSSVEGLLSDTKNMIDLDDVAFGERPSIIYLIVPDDDQSFHTLAACFVDQLYKSGVKIANLNQMISRTSEATLTRQVQFYLDEFGNFPTIPAMPEMITVARSRNIFFMLILQDYMQLNKSYGADDGKTIKNNCNGNIYMRTNDSDTASQLEKEYGDKPILSFGTGENMSVVQNKRQTQDKKEIVDKITGSISTVPLIRSNEILNIDDNFMIVKKTGKNPAVVHSIYAYLIQDFKKIMGMQKAFIPSSSINFMKDHYFSFMSKDYEEWIKVLEDNDELFLEIEDDLLNDDSIFDELDKNAVNLIQKNNLVDDFENYHNALNEKNIKTNGYKSNLIKEVDKPIRNNDYGFPHGHDEFDAENMRERRNERKPRDLYERRTENNRSDDKSRLMNTNSSSSIEKLLEKASEEILTIEQIKEKIEYNYSRLSRIKKDLGKFSNLLSSQMSTKEKEKQKQLYDEQLKLSQENKLLIIRCQAKID